MGEHGELVGRIGFTFPYGASEHVTLSAFELEFRQIFRDRYAEVFRVVDRFGGDPSLAADVAQETFVRLYRRGAMPDDVRAWLVSVALNLARDERRRVTRRLRLLARRTPEETMSDAPPSPEDRVLVEERRARVRCALDRLTERERGLLLLRHEGYSYRQLAEALGLTESSVGTLLARAKAAFRAAYESEARTRDRATPAGEPDATI